VTTFKLLWGSTWRGGTWGIALGALLGMIYGALFMVALFFAAMSNQTNAAPQSADAPRGLIAILFLMFIGSIMGALFGMPTGVFIGLIDGLVLGVLTRVFFYPIRDALRFRRVLAIVSALISIVGSWTCFALILLLFAQQHSVSVTTMVVVGAIPALIAGAGGVFVSRRIVEWYSKLEIGSSSKS
jgi:eukaryotic-like serine/threonine-protein kinase